MPTASSFVSTLLVSAIFALPSLGVLLPYKDSSCSKPIHATYDNSPAFDDPAFFALNSAQDTPSRFSNIDFPDTTSNDGAALTVYWKASEIDEGCRLVLMKDYLESSYNNLPDRQAPGNIILNVGDDECHYTSIESGADLSGVFCCGIGDCSLYSTGNPQLLGKRDSDPSPPLPAVVSKEPMALHRSFIKERRQTSTNVERSPIDPKAWACKLFGPALIGPAGALLCGCSLVDPGEPFSSAGQQTMITSVNDCPTGGSSCSFTITDSVTVGSTLTSSVSQTITTTKSTTKTKTATFANILSSSDGDTSSISNAFTNGTSLGYQDTHARSVGNTLVQEPGSTAFVTFTPTFMCIASPVTCDAGDNVSADFWYCSPQTNTLADGTEAVVGSYSLVYL